MIGKPKCSIIIPTYNNNIKLVRLLNSIPVGNDYEVIVVDDNPDGGAFELKKRFENVFFYINEFGRGAGGARNTGLKYAVGEYVLFADSDDEFFIKSLVNLSFPDTYDVVYFPPTSFLSNTEQERGTRHKKYEKLVFNYLYNHNEDIKYHYYVPWSKLIKRNFLDHYNIRFDEVMYSNDIFFSLKVGFFSSSIHVTDTVIYKVEEGEESLTKTISVSSIETRLDSLQRFNEFLIVNGLSSKQVMALPLLLKLVRMNWKKGFRRFFSTLFSKRPVIIDFRFYNLFQ